MSAYFKLLELPTELRLMIFEEFGLIGDYSSLLATSHQIRAEVLSLVPHGIRFQLRPRDLPGDAAHPFVMDQDIHLEKLTIIVDSSEDYLLQFEAIRFPGCSPRRWSVKHMNSLLAKSLHCYYMCKTLAVEFRAPREGNHLAYMMITMRHKRREVLTVILNGFHSQWLLSSSTERALPELEVHFWEDDARRYQHCFWLNRMSLWPGPNHGPGPGVSRDKLWPGTGEFWRY